MLIATSSSGIVGWNLVGSAPASGFLAACSNLKDISLTQGDVLQEVGEAIRSVYFPRSGMISLQTVMQNGSAVETAAVGREGAVGALSGLGARIAPHTAVVQIEGIASRIDVARFEAAVGGSACIRDVIMRYNDFLMMMIQQSAGCNALHPLEKRLCRWLLQAQDRNDRDGLPLTQEVLSQLLGVRRTTLTIIAHDLHAAGLIRYRRGNIEYWNEQALGQGGECYAAIRHHGEESFPLRLREYTLSMRAHVAWPINFVGYVRLPGDGTPGRPVGSGTNFPD